MTRRPFRRPSRPASPLFLVLLLGCATTAPDGEKEHKIHDDVVCRVNGNAIHRSDVEVKKQQSLPPGAFHGTADEATQQGMRRSALQSLIDEELEYQDARKRGLSVDPEKVAREYTRLAKRYGGSDAFEARIERSGIESGEVRAALEREFLIAQVKEVVADAEREVSEEETRRYFAEHADSFQLPRRAEVRQILIYMPPLERDPNDWKRAFERASALRARVEAGESFATLATEVSHAPEGERAEGGRIGVIHPGQLEASLDAALWSLQPGETSEPIRAFKGVYLLWVDHFVDPRSLTYDEIAERLKILVQKEQRRQALDDWLTSLRERAEIEIIDPSLAPVADETSGTL